MKTPLLSPTEKQIAESVASGNSLKEIAAQRFRSLETVKTHVKNICKKWNARGVVDITRIFTLENTDLFKNCVIAFFIGLQSFMVLGSLKVERKVSTRTSHSVVRVVRGKRKNEWA